MKVCKFLLSASLLFGSMVSPVYAAETKSTPSIDVNYDTALGHGDRTKDEIFEELRSNSLSEEDAEFYAKLDILVAELERKGIEVEPPNDISEYSDEYYKANKKEIRENALKLDRKALKTLFAKNKAIGDGEKDIKKTLRVLKNKLKPGKEFKFTVEYPDGSSATYSGITTKVSEDTPEVSTNTTHLGGPWNREGDSFYSENRETFGTFTTKTDWSFKSGVGFAKVGDTLKWGITKGSKSLTYYSDTGASSYSGVVLVDKEYLSNKDTGYTDGGDYVLQGYTDVVFKVSASFSASKWGLGISVSAGGAWHQYCITEVVNLGNGSAWVVAAHPATYF